MSVVGGIGEAIGCNSDGVPFLLSQGISIRASTKRGGIKGRLPSHETVSQKNQNACQSNFSIYSTKKIDYGLLKRT